MYTCIHISNAVNAVKINMCCVWYKLCYIQYTVYNVKMFGVVSDVLCKCVVFQRASVLCKCAMFQRVSVLSFRGSVYCINVPCFRGPVYCVNVPCFRGSVCRVSEGQCTV